MSNDPAPGFIDNPVLGGIVIAVCVIIFLAFLYYTFIRK